MSKTETEIKAIVTARSVGDAANELEASRQGEKDAEAAANFAIDELKTARERREDAVTKFDALASDFT